MGRRTKSSGGAARSSQAPLRDSERGLRASKRYSQNFLQSRKVIDAIVAEVAGYASVLEIGPGLGAISAPLSEQVACLVAIELDERMVAAAQAAAPKAHVRQGDALELDWSAELARLARPRAIVSNMPYAITGALLQAVGRVSQEIDAAVLMMQKEVGERILAPAGDPERGSLSVFLQRRFLMRKVCAAPKGAFVPAPKVDSVVLSFEPRPVARDPQFEAAFEALCRAGFSQPRKTLANNLRAWLGGRGLSAEVSRSAVDSAWAGTTLSPDVRPHEVTEAEWEALCKGVIAAVDGLWEATE